jgi:hypothetical protein
MRKYLFKTILALVLVGLLHTSCTDYLDKAPDSGLTEEVVFSKYANFTKFFYSVYDGKNGYHIRCAYPLYLAFWDVKYGWETLTDAADAARRLQGHDWKSGLMGPSINHVTYDVKKRPMLVSMFRVIRVCNMALDHVDEIQDATPEDIEDLRAQAYFIRGYAHFSLMRVWGPMPHITHVIQEDDNWDIPRLSKFDSYNSVALDMDSAFTAFEKAGRIRRDPGPGEDGHLNDPHQKRPNGVAAKALKARALLYAASPLNNQNGTKDWEDAAKASWDAIKVAEEYKYALLPFSNYTDNYYGSQYTNEQIWAWNAGNGRGYNHGELQGIMSGIFQGKTSYASGECPTQNMVDKFETKWGDPLYTAEERNAAAAAGHYNEQDPYVNRDPRFYKTIIYNTASIVWPTVPTGEVKNRANIYYESKNGQIKYATHQDQGYQGVTRTGYYVRKYCGDMSVKNKTKIHMTDPLFRLGELYLNYAEAVNEAYGPSGSVAGAGMTATAALNVIRNRATMPDLNSMFTANQDIFRDRIKNERSIELCFEGFHRYHDLRRWMDAPKVMSGPLYGVDIEKVAKSDTYPTGFKYIRQPLPDDRQSRWYDYMYYFPFDTNDYYKLKNFDTSLNPAW